MISHCLSFSSEATECSIALPWSDPVYYMNIQLYFHQAIPPLCLCHGGEISSQGKPAQLLIIYSIQHMFTGLTKGDPILSRAILITGTATLSRWTIMEYEYWRTTPFRFHKRCICLKKVQIRIRYQKRQWSKLLTIFETLSPNNILTGEISRISTLFTFGWLASDDRLNIYYGAVRLLNACCLATQMKQ